MRVTENKGITLLYISNGIHFKLSSLSAISLENQAFAELTPDFTPINVKSGVFLFLDRIIQFIV